MPTATWKSVERKIAGLLGGVRTGNSGRNTNDVTHDWLAVEIKHRKSLPSLIKGAMTQARINALKGNLLPVVVLHEERQPFTDSFVVLRLADFVDYFGSAAPWAGQLCECGQPAEWPSARPGVFLCQECWEAGDVMPCDELEPIPA